MARFPRFDQVRPPCPLRPPTSAEAREHHAIRLALILTAGVLQAGAFAADHPVLPGGVYGRLAWLRQALQPLARHAPTVAVLVRLLNLDGPRIAWDDHRTLRRQLLRLAAEAEHLGLAMSGQRSGRRRA